MEVSDTVGAGDAFLAAWIQGQFLEGWEPKRALNRACRLAEFVASQSGATPEYHWVGENLYKPGTGRISQ
ncbi:MAG: hypothetical protein HC904_16305 [Blastochloris sp.]|nr:hypothetical protein [Blastochloris sp.]